MSKMTNQIIEEIVPFSVMVSEELTFLESLGKCDVENTVTLLL